VPIRGTVANHFGGGDWMSLSFMPAIRRWTASESWASLTRFEIGRMERRTAKIAFRSSSGRLRISSVQCGSGVLGMAREHAAPFGGGGGPELDLLGW
jgi:hypothetical protein